jgi:hypothetical protein
MGHFLLAHTSFAGVEKDAEILIPAVVVIAVSRTSARIAINEDVQALSRLFYATIRCAAIL